MSAPDRNARGRRSASRSKKEGTTPLQKGGVGIVDANSPLNTLTGDIISHDRGKYTVKLRGHDEVVQLSKESLVELSKRSEEFAIGEKLRIALLEEGELQGSRDHVKQRILAMQLADEFSYIVKYHTDPVGFNPLPETEAQQALVRFLEAYYVGQGCFGTDGRKMTSFYMTMFPFYTHLGEGRIAGMQAQTTGATIDWCRDVFRGIRVKSGKLKPGLIFRAFAFAQHRMDFHKNGESLLDAFCVSFYVIQLMQGKEMEDVEHEEGVQNTFMTYGKEELGCYQTKHVLWCFCRVFLKLAIVARDAVAEHQYNLLLPEPYGSTVHEQAKIADLLIRLRPESPESHLAAYQSRMDVKDLVPIASEMKDYMAGTYRILVSGKETSDRVGDPLYQYLSHMACAYWMPTDTCVTPHTLGDIKLEMKRASKYMAECDRYTPHFLFSLGKQCEGASKAYMNHIKNKVSEDCIIPKMNAYIYHSFRFGGKYYAPGGKFDNLAGRFKCANCSKQLVEARSCGKCGKLYYCTRQCQKVHWHASHKHVCKPKSKSTSK